MTAELFKALVEGLSFRPALQELRHAPGFFLRHGLSAQAGRLYFSENVPAGRQVLRIPISYMVSDQPLDGYSQLTEMKHKAQQCGDVFQENQLKAEVKKAVLGLNLLMAARGKSAYLKACAMDILAQEPQGRSLFQWTEQASRSISALGILSQWNNLHPKHLQFCNAIGRNLFAPSMAQTVDFRRTYHLASERILPLKLPAHMDQADCPLFICPFLSEFLYFRGRDNVELEGQFDRLKREFLIKLVTTRKVETGERLVFKINFPDQEGLLRYGDVSGFVRLVLDFNGFQQLASQLTDLKSALIRESILSVGISRAGIQFKDLSRLRLFCMTEKDLQAIGGPANIQRALKKALSAENQGRVKTLLRQSCQMCLQPREQQRRLESLSRESGSAGLRAVVQACGQELKVIEQFKSRL